MLFENPPMFMPLSNESDQDGQSSKWHLIFSKNFKISFDEKILRDLKEHSKKIVQFFNLLKPN